MNKNLKTLASISVFSLFIFLAYGSEDDKKGINDVTTEASNPTNSQKDSTNVATKESKEKAEKALKTFKKNKDEFEGTTFYKDPRTPNSTNTNFIYPYIGNKDNQYWLRLKFQYASEDWLFIKNATLMIDDEKFEVSGNWERDHNSGIWEWLDIPVEQKEYEILRKIANSKTTKIRYEGTQYHDDRTLTSKEKDIIKKTLEVYDGLK